MSLWDRNNFTTECFHCHVSHPPQTFGTDGWRHCLRAGHRHLGRRCLRRIVAKMTVVVEETGGDDTGCLAGLLSEGGALTVSFPSDPAIASDRQPSGETLTRCQRRDSASAKASFKRASGRGGLTSSAQGCVSFCCDRNAIAASRWRGA